LRTLRPFQRQLGRFHFRSFDGTTQRATAKDSPNSRASVTVCREYCGQVQDAMAMEKDLLWRGAVYCDLRSLGIGPCWQSLGEMRFEC
jgi:hypothetical protein